MVFLTVKRHIHPAFLCLTTQVAVVCSLTASYANGNDKDHLKVSQSLPLAMPSAVVPPIVRPTTRRSNNKSNKSNIVRSHYQKGLSFKEQGDSNHALVEFLKSGQENPNLVEAFFEQALIFRQRGYRKLAQSALEEALAVKPEYQQARILLATIRLEDGNIGGAVSELSRSLGLETIKIKVPNEADSPQTAILQSLHKLLPIPDEDNKQESNLASEPLLGNGEVEVKKVPEEKLEKSEKNERSENEAPGAVRSITLTSEANSNIVQGSAKHHEKSWFSRLFGKDAPQQLIQEAEGEKIVKTVQSADLAPESAMLPDQHADNIAKETKRLTETLSDRYLQDQTDADKNNAPLTYKESLDETAQTPQPLQTPQTGTFFSQSDLGLAKTAKPLLSFAPASKLNTAAKPAEEPAKASDDWTRRLKYLQEHGTGSLKDGEAFMFSEDTGEAVLFLASGESIRRQIAKPIDSEQVMHERRPDISAPIDLLYNLSLLGKLIPKQADGEDETPPPPPSQPPVDGATFHNSSNDFTFSQKHDSTEVLDSNDGFWGMIKKVFKI